MSEARSNLRPSMRHVPVLLSEVVEGLAIGPGSVAIDGTAGGGGHTAAMLEHSAPNGRVLALDADPEAIRRVGERLAQEVANGRLRLVQSAFVEMQQVAQREGFVPADAILLDLGVSSFQLESPARGFSLMHEGPLDMRFDPHQGVSAEEIVNSWSERDLANVIFEFGEEPRSRRIARAIVQRRPISTTLELAEVVERALGGRRGERIHPATRTFQALRIAVNEELAQLADTLAQSLTILRPGGSQPGGHIAVISFHSLEDRIVKQWMQKEASDFVREAAHPMGGFPREPTLRILTKKPIVPGSQELEENPRSRSAKLRIAERLP